MRVRTLLVAGVVVLTAALAHAPAEAVVGGKAATPGQRAPGLGTSDDLRYAGVNVVADDDCATTAGLVSAFDASTAVCASAFLKDACYGDGGGPLWGVKGGTRIQIGIVNYGTASCGKPGVPFVYAELNNPDIASFISSTIGT